MYNDDDLNCIGLDLGPTKLTSETPKAFCKLRNLPFHQHSSVKISIPCLGELSL